MSGKRHKGKHSHQSRKAKLKQRQMSGIQPVAPVAPAAAAPPAAAPPAVKPVPAPEPVAVAAGQYQHVPGELKRIAILAGIIIVVLIILAVILT